MTLTLLVLAVPLTLRFFDPEIQTEMATMHREELAPYTLALSTDARFTPLAALDRDVTALQAQISAGVAPDAVLKDPEVVALTASYTAISAAYDSAEREVACEKDGTCGSGRVGAGPAFEEKRAAVTVWPPNGKRRRRR